MIISVLILFPFKSLIAKEHCEYRLNYWSKKLQALRIASVVTSCNKKVHNTKQLKSAEKKPEVSITSFKKAHLDPAAINQQIKESVNGRAFKKNVSNPTSLPDKKDKIQTAVSEVFEGSAYYGNGSIGLNHVNWNNHTHGELRVNSSR
jgi:hypothetical protein